MLRYNHGLVEAKWRKTWEQSSSLAKAATVSTIFVPQGGVRLELENARLLVWADFFAWAKWGTRTSISLRDVRADWLMDASKLGLLGNSCCEKEFDLVVLPRDYAHPCSIDQMIARETFFVGRLLQTEAFSLGDLLSDFGGDALRLYFLCMGPPERDYRFQWYGLVGSYRFVTRLWELGQESLVADPNFDCSEPPSLLDLRTLVQERLAKQKPHTALAAIMGYLKTRTKLTRTEIRALARLLQPFTPFVSAELLQLVAAVKDHNGRERDRTDA